MQTSTDQCQGMVDEHCLGACEKKETSHHYNERVLQAIASLTARPSYIVLDQGLNEEELSCIMVINGSFFGMGYLPKNFNTITEAAIAEYIKPYKENSYIRTLLNTHISQFPHQVKHLPNG
jgi:DNA polymerase-3 subunit epsilon